MPDEQWTEVRDIVQDRDQDHPHGKEMQKSKMAVWGGKGEKESYKHLNAEFQRIARRDQKAFFSDQCKERKTTEWERLGISSRKSEIPMEHFMQR